MTKVYSLLEQMDVNAASTREKERDLRIWSGVVAKDETQSQYYDAVWPYADWARETGLPANDAGIDLVARRRGDGGFVAVQCKFYARDYVLQKSDLDSFLSASGKAHFVERLFVDTTAGEMGKNAEQMVKGQAIPFRRIGLNDLEASRIDWAKFTKDAPIAFKPKKQPRPHQIDALAAVREGPGHP